MTRNCHVSCVLLIMVLFTSLSFLQLSTSNPVSTIEDYDNQPREVLPRLPDSKTMDGMQRRGQLASKDQNEEEGDLFKDVDPKRLATVLLEALNHTYVERERDKEKYNNMKDKIQAERDKNEEIYSERVARERDGQNELELYVASQEKEREEEKKKTLEEEERITEKVTSHTTSQKIQIKTKQQPSSSDGTTKSGAASQQVSSNPEQSSYEDEQLNPEEFKSLATMMKEFPRLNIKRDGVSEHKQRNTRGYSSYNDIIPVHKGSNLALTKKKKLKWQEETQKAIYFPTFTTDNSVEEFENSNYISKTTQPPSPTEHEEVQGDDTEEENEILSPEEEEAQAKVEQEEMMRQAAEAQKAKMEEEKLADIASDMLLSYMVKQNKGDKKHSLFLSNAAEDKRSDEEHEMTEEDDIDPETIDKLIEISSKLHLPADDVVDIITDVEEKKKKKDLPAEMASLWQYTSSPLPTSLRSGWQVSTNQNSLPVSKQLSPAVKILKTWFQEKNTPKPDVSQRQLSKPLLPYLSPKPEKLFSVKPEHWSKLPKSVWTGYSLYPYSYLSYHQRKPILDYYHFYFPPIPKSKPHYYMSKPALTLNNYYGNSMADPYIFPPKRHYQSWFQPQLRKSPVSLQHKSLYSSYYPRLYSQPFQRLPTSQACSPPQIAPQKKQFLFPAPEPPAKNNNNCHKSAKQPDRSIHDNVGKYIQQILMNRAQRLD